MNWFERINKAMVESPDKMPVALFLLILIYIIAELHNVAGMNAFSEAAGFFAPWLTSVMFGLLLFVTYWFLIGYRAKGWRTWPLWGVLLAFTAISMALNYLHAANAEGQALGLVIPLIILLGGWLAKDLIGYQMSETKLALTLKSLTDQQRNLEQTIAQLKQEKAATERSIEAQKQALSTDIERKQAELAALQSEITEAQLSLEQWQVEARQVKKNDFQPTKIELEAIRLDALLAAGKTLKAASQMVGVSENTARSRLGLMNGQSLREVVS